MSWSQLALRQASKTKNVCSQTLKSLGHTFHLFLGARTHLVTMTIKFFERPASDIFTACCKVTIPAKNNRRSHPPAKMRIRHNSRRRSYDMLQHILYFAARVLNFSAEIRTKWAGVLRRSARSFPSL